MKLKLIYATKEVIPERAEGFYSESGGQWKLNIEGVKTQEDIDRVKNALEKERDLKIEAERQLAQFKDVDLDIWEKVKDIDPENPGAGLDPKDEKEINRRISEAVRERERELRDLHTKELAAATSEKEEVENRFKQNHLKQWRRNMLAERFGFKNLDDLDTFLLKIEHSDLSEFVELRNRLKSLEVQDEGGGYRVVGGEYKDGKGAEEILENISKAEVAKNFRPAPDHQGGGAGNKGGGNPGGVNPYKKETWNLTEQGKLESDNPAEAKRLATQAGVQIESA